MSDATWMKRMYKKPWFRAFMRAVRIAVATGLSALIGALIKDPNTPLWLTPILVALDKYLRDKGVY